MTREEVLFARGVEAAKKTDELMPLAIQAHALFEDFNFEVYADIARQMARVHAKQLHPDEEEA